MTKNNNIELNIKNKTDLFINQFLMFENNTKLHLNC